VYARDDNVQAALEQLAEVIASDLGPEVTFLISATDVDKRR